MPRYNLDSLGCWQFEELCQSLAKPTYGLTETWGGPNGDLGRDVYADRDLIDKEGRPIPGPVVFQAKFVANANAAGATPADLVKNAINKECSRISERISQKLWAKLPKTYVVMTNAPLDKELKSYIADKVAAQIPSCDVVGYGSSDMCDLLDNNPKIRLAFPQILSFRDLQALIGNTLHGDILARSLSALEDAKEAIDVFVPTVAYRHALTVLETHHFVVLTGPPEMGKTTIGRMIAWSYATLEWQVVECTSPDDLLHLYNAEEQQVFVADDVFGSTEYKPSKALPWEKDLSHVLRKMDQNHWLILTSRPTPLSLALGELDFQGRAEQFPKPAEVQVETTGLSLEDKTKILYRHAKSAGLSDDAKDVLKRYAVTIVRALPL